jgi:transcriptional regulator with XRE-family HTH domain
MKSTLNTELLASMIKSKRGTRGLRAVATEIGEVSAATLSRVEQGKVPDIDTFIRICKWLQVSADTFTSNNGEVEVSSNRDLAVAHLRADRALSADMISMLVKMIDLAYNSTAK